MLPARRAIQRVIACVYPRVFKIFQHWATIFPHLFNHFQLRIVKIALVKTVLGEGLLYSYNLCNWTEPLEEPTI